MVVIPLTWKEERFRRVKLVAKSIVSKYTIEYSRSNWCRKGEMKRKY